MFSVGINVNEFRIFKRKKILIKNLLISLKLKSGRSNSGRLILNGRGGGYCYYYRLIDFKRLVSNIPAKVINFYYDPNRNIYIMKLLYLNGIITYSLAPLLVNIGMMLINNNINFLKNGGMFKVSNCLIGSFINSVKVNTVLSKYARAAGTFVQLIRKIGSYVLLRLPSKEELFIYNFNMCMLGRLSNVNCKLVKRTSAGFFRRIGFKSKVRGVVKNPIDHPHGGGEGRTTAAQPSVTPWGIYTKGVRTTRRFQHVNFNSWGFFRRRDGMVW